MSKSVLVTGGAGYIGSHTVVELADSGFRPIIVDDFSNSEPSVLEGIDNILGERKFAFYQGDCGDRDFLKSVLEKEGPIVGAIHFAAFKAVGESVEIPVSYYRNNINTLIVLLDLCDEFQIENVVFSSSCTVYGQSKELPVTEETERLPAASPYGKTKQFCEDILSDQVTSIGMRKDESKLKVIALRYFNPIGAHPSAQIGELPRGIPNNLVPFVTQSAAGLRGPITIFGDDYETPDGTCLRDYIHVVDLAKAHVAAMNFLDSKPKSIYQVFNVGTGTGTSVLDVITSFEKVSGTKLNYSVGPRRSGDVEKIFANVDLSRKELKWKCVYNVEDALTHAWKWQQKISNE